VVTTGARLGGQVGSGPVVLTPYLGAYWVDHAQTDDREGFSTGGTANTIELKDVGVRNFARIDFGATAKTIYGLEGFAKAAVDTGTGVSGWTANLGVRWRW
jgi:outer membrane autotransporter protein